MMSGTRGDVVRNVALALLILLSAPFFAGCSDDDAVTNPPPVPNPKILERKDDVLHNLQLAYNQRNPGEVERILDENFVFHFSPNDVQQGLVANSSWGKDEEMNATTNLLRAPGASAQIPVGLHASSPIESATWGMIKEIFYNRAAASADALSLEMSYPEGDEAWQPVVPSGSGSHSPLYQKTVEYFLQVKVGDITYTQNRAVRARFVVVPVNVDGKDIWKLIWWHDDVPPPDNPESPDR